MSAEQLLTCEACGHTFLPLRTAGLEDGGDVMAGGGAAGDVERPTALCEGCADT